MERAGEEENVADNEDVEMREEVEAVESVNGEPATEEVKNGDDTDGATPSGSGAGAEVPSDNVGNVNEGDVQLYVNWAEEAAAARRPSDEPLPESLIQVMAKVFNNDMLVENILEKVIFDNDRATIRASRLVSKNWLTALAKLYRKMKKPQFLVNTNKDTIGAMLNEPRPRPMFEQHTLLYEFIKPMTTNIRHEGFIPTFSLTLGPSYFRKSNYTDFVNCLVQCGPSLVELYIHFPKNSAMSFLLPPDINLPNLATFGVSFSGQSLLGHHFPVPYHHQHDYFPNYCSIHLVQCILNASKSLRNFHFLHCTSPMNPPDIENLYLPETLAAVHIETPLRDFDLFLRRPLPCLTELRINATIALYPEETVYELLSKLSPTLRTVWLTGPPATRRSLPIRLPRLEHVTKFYMFKPWEFEEREPLTNFEEVFPRLETLVFANQTQYSFNYLMKGMRSTTVTSFCVCLTSFRPTQPGIMIHFPEDAMWRDVREEERIRREMQNRIERMRDLALRGQRIPRRGENDPLQNQNQDRPAPLILRQRVVGVPADRPAAAIRRRDQNEVRVQLREEQMRNRMNVQLLQLRVLRERYERSVRARRGGQEEPIPPPPNPPAPAPENRNPAENLFDLMGPERYQYQNLGQRPVLEIRRVYPPAAHRRQAEVDYAAARGRAPRWLMEHMPLPAGVGMGRGRGYAGARDREEIIINPAPAVDPPPQNQNREREREPAAHLDLAINNQLNAAEAVRIEAQMDELLQNEGAARNGDNDERQEAQGENRERNGEGNGEEPAQEPQQGEANREAGVRVQNVARAGQRQMNGDADEGNGDRIDPNDADGMEVVVDGIPAEPRNPDPQLMGLDVVDLSSDELDSDDDDGWERPLNRAVQHARGHIHAFRRERFGLIPIVPDPPNENRRAGPGNAGAGAAGGPRVDLPQPVRVEVRVPANNNNNAPVQDNNERDQAAARRQAFARARERMLHRARLGRPPVHRPGHAQQQPNVGVRRGEHYIEFWDMRNPMIPPPLPDRPVTMTKDKMQSINLAFPNLVKLTIQVCGPETCGLRYIFDEMRSLQSLKIIVESSLWNIKWDSLFTGIPDDFCEAVKTNSEIWDEVYLTENPASIRNMTKLEELMLLETVKSEEPQNRMLEERHISDVAFHFGFFKLKALKRLTVTSGFSPTKTMYNRWYEEKGYKIKTKPKTKLDLNYYAEQ